MTTQDVSADPRWQAFNQDGFPCSCGERHVGLFPVNMLTPAMWDGPKEYAPDEEIQLDRTFISESYCVWQGQNFAMRMRLPLQMRGASPAAAAGGTPIASETPRPGPSSALLVIWAWSRQGPPVPARSARWWPGGPRSGSG